MRGAGGGNHAQFQMRTRWHLLLGVNGLWCLFSACSPRCLFVLDNTTIHPMAPALQSEEMTLLSLQSLSLRALVPVCSVAGAGAVSH